MDGIDLGRQRARQVETVRPSGNHQIHANLVGTESFRNGTKAGGLRPCADEKGPAIAGPLELARPAGFEPTTPWFVGAPSQVVMYGNQRLAVLANPLSGHIKAHFGHSQAVPVTITFLRTAVQPAKVTIKWAASMPAF